MLPEANAYANTDDGLMIGIKRGDAIIDYAGLSGGELVSFNAALCHALGANVLNMEAAELDSKNLTTILGKLARLDMQVIVSTCHDPMNIPEGWTVAKI